MWANFHKNIDQNEGLAFGRQFLCLAGLILIEIVVEEPASTVMFYFDDSNVEVFASDSI